MIYERSRRVSEGEPEVIGSPLLFKSLPKIWNRGARPCSHQSAHPIPTADDRSSAR
jgi:hypothetical protein